MDSRDHILYHGDGGRVQGRSRKEETQSKSTVECVDSSVATFSPIGDEVNKQSRSILQMTN